MVLANLDLCQLPPQSPTSAVSGASVVVRLRSLVVRVVRDIIDGILGPSSCKLTTSIRCF